MLSNKKSFIHIFFIVILLISISTTSIGFDIEEETDYVWLQSEIENASANSSKEPNLNSRYAVVFDRTSKLVIFGKNENERVPMASTTKIMTAIVLLEYLEGNDNLNLNSKIEVSKEATSIWGSRIGLKTGDKITINDLLYGLMLCSRKRCGNTNSNNSCRKCRRICKFDEQKGTRNGTKRYAFCNTTRTG